MSRLEPCPGTHLKPARSTRYNMPVHPDSGWCRTCGREYVLNNDGTVRAHRATETGADQ